MEIKRKKLHNYDCLLAIDPLYLDESLESIYKALQDTDENNYEYLQALIKQNSLLQKQLMALIKQNSLLQKQLMTLEDKITMLEMKINYLLDNPKH